MVSEAPKAGSCIGGRYRLDELLGRGGHAVVWGATHVVTGKRVALKVVEKPGPRGLIEARAASRLEHPNVIRIHDVFDEDGRLVIVMDWLVGESLAMLLERSGPLPVERGIDLLLPVLDAIGMAHRAGIVHRDLKPSNIFVAEAGTTDERLVLLDFGIAKTLDHLLGETAHTESGAILGTPQYMAPEQLFGESTTNARADLWSIGIVLSEVFSGRRPTDAPNVGGVLKRITTKEIVPLRVLAPTLPAALLDHVDVLLSFDAAKRPETVESTIALFRAMRSGTIAIQSPPVWSRARRFGLVAIAVTSLTFASFALFALFALFAKMRGEAHAVLGSSQPPSAPAEITQADAGEVLADVAASSGTSSAPAVSARREAPSAPKPAKSTVRKPGIIQENPYPD